jgi:hypothetical protein
MVIEMIGRIHEIFPEKKIREGFSVVEFVLSYFLLDGKEQYRYIQAVGIAKDKMSRFQKGDTVKVKVVLKGKYRVNSEDKKKFFMNLDEAINIE